MNTELKYNKEARELLKKGVDAVADAVKVSLGAEGRNVIIPSKDGGYIITKDGVSIAKTVLPEGRFERIGAALIKEAASRTNNFAGDGTTTATVIAQSIFDKGLQALDKNPGLSSVDLKRGIDQATEDVVAELSKMAQEVSKDNLESVATISANGDSELGRLIAKAFNKIGKHGTVISAVSNTAKTYIEMRNGVELDRGFYHPMFVTDRVKEVCELKNPLVLLHRGKIEKGDAIVNLFSQVFSSPSNSLLIIADDVDPFVLSTIAENIKKGAIAGKICIVKTPQILKIERDLMGDVAVLTGAQVVSETEGVKLTPSVLGRLNKTIVTENSTLLVGDSDNLQDLVEEITQRIEYVDNKFEKEELQERLSRITGGVATLYVGAKSDSELKEKQDRIEDSINATRSALEEGIVPGGGVALENVSTILEGGVEAVAIEEPTSFDIGYKIVLEACKAPINQICINAGFAFEPQPVKGNGIDVKTRKPVNMIEAGIIDPKKVTRCAIENASSVASTFLTTEAVVAVV